MQSENDLSNLCLALIADSGMPPSLRRQFARPRQEEIFESSNGETLRAEIRSGLDPLGDAFSRIRSSQERRSAGAVYTPHKIVRSMVDWLASEGTPDRIVDPGAGSGRFILAAGAAFPKAQLVAVEMDPLAALMLHANLFVRGMAERATIFVKDYREVELPRIKGVTGFVGNPPYVRHHDIDTRWKTWYAERFSELGIKASGLAGLHLHFFLQTRLLARPGDVGTFITSSEWIDVNYGSALRRLFLEQLGGLALHVLDPKVEAFPGTASTAAISCFRVGESALPVKVRSVANAASLNGLQRGKAVARDQLKSTTRWSAVLRPPALDAGGTIELGELCRVHRGQVTGANSIWIASTRAGDLPDRVKIPTVTKARDLLEAGDQLHCADLLRRVIDLPSDLDEFSKLERADIESFLCWAKTQGADQGYIARHRKAWWSVGLKPPAPILCTYMARRPPQFTLNSCGARHINIAHGLYPREGISTVLLAQLVAWLNANVNTGSGRTYAGGLTKFEPKEIERLRIPPLDQLHS